MQEGVPPRGAFKSSVQKGLILTENPAYKFKLKDLESEVRDQDSCFATEHTLGA